jgi:lipid II:glycine glycyltransferase (peptidoglycan interpeptide bridge formation enzyme)
MDVVSVTKDMREKYDAFIKGMPHGNFRQGYAFGEVMSYDHEIFRLAALRDGTIAGVISLQKKRLPASPFSFFYAPRGPVVDYGDTETFAALIDAAQNLAKRHRAIFIRIDPDALDDDTVARQRLLAAGFRYLDGKNWSFFNYPRVLMRLDTTVSEELLLKGLRKKHRQHINNLASKGVTLESVQGVEGLKEFYELMSELSIRKGFPLRSLGYYRNLMSEFGEDARILIARHEGTNLAGVLSLVYGNKAWYMHGATVDDKGSIHPAEGLHWEMIRWAHERGCLFYDFGGTGTDYPPREDNPNYILYHFKKGFGAEIHYLTGYYDLVCNRSLYQLFRIMEEKGLPLAMKARAGLRRRFSHHE